MSEKLKTLEELEYLRGIVYDKTQEQTKSYEWIVADSFILRKEAINAIKATQLGECDWPFDIIPESMRGKFPAANWNDEVFIIGLEYGLIYAFMHFFNLTEKDLQNGICDNTNIEKEPEKD